MQAFGYLQGWKQRNLSRQPVLVLSHHNINIRKNLVHHEVGRALLRQVVEFNPWRYSEVHMTQSNLL